MAEAVAGSRASPDCTRAVVVRSALAKTPASLSDVAVIVAVDIVSVCDQLRDRHADGDHRALTGGDLSGCRRGMGHPGRAADRGAEVCNCLPCYPYW